jgi:hypothetical protein
VPPFRAAQIVGARFAFFVSVAHVKDRLKQGDGVFESGLEAESEIGGRAARRLVGETEVREADFSPSETVSVNTCAFGRSRPAADASREVVERWLLDGLDVSVGHRRCSCDPSSQNNAGRTPAP